MDMSKAKIFYYKEHVIDLLQRVCTDSVKTMEILQQIPTE
jgi:hypothetical protein